MKGVDSGSDRRRSEGSSELLYRTTRGGAMLQTVRQRAPPPPPGRRPGRRRATTGRAPRRGSGRRPESAPPTRAARRRRCALVPHDPSGIMPAGRRLQRRSRPRQSRPRPSAGSAGASASATFQRRPASAPGVVLLFPSTIHLSVGYPLMPYWSESVFSAVASHLANDLGLYDCSLGSSLELWRKLLAVAAPGA